MKNFLILSTLILFIGSVQASERTIAEMSLQLRVEKCIPKQLAAKYNFDQAKNICVDMVKSTVATEADRTFLEKLREL